MAQTDPWLWSGLPDRWWLGLLLATGVGYGVKLYRKRKQQEKVIF